MPKIFHDNGFGITVFDPPLANYKYSSDLSVYDDMPYVNGYLTFYNGMFSIDGMDVNSVSESLNHNLIRYSLMKIAPVMLQNIIYNMGAYLSVDYYKFMFHENMSVSNYTDLTFLKSYAVLKNLTNITNIKEDNRNNFLLLYNGATHDETILQEPEYEPRPKVNNIEYDKEHPVRYSIYGDELSFENSEQISYYQVNMATFMSFGEWFEYLRENGVYDNTRIIIVADHGFGLGLFDDLIFNDEGEENDIMRYNPILLYKDFNSTGFHRNDEYMTNADTIVLATKDIIDNPTNPFTGNQISSREKKDEKVFVSNRGTLIDSYQIINGKWYIVKGNALDKTNWKLAE